MSIPSALVTWPRRAATAPVRFTHGWGATEEEQCEALPGDELVADPAITATRAVTIHAPVERVWAWLVQIGQDRGGMYSYDALENLLGLGIHSAHDIHPEWQHPEVGDRVVLVPPGAAGMAAGYSMPIAAVDPPHTLVLRQSPPEHPWDAVWSFHVRPLADGRSRLISRSRSHRRGGPAGALDLALDAVMDPVTWVMTRKMLLGIRERAEGGFRPLLRRQLDHDVARLPAPSAPIDDGLVHEDDLAPLPDPARRFLRWMGVVDRPRVRSFEGRFRGEIRQRPDQHWMPYDAWQHNRSDPITRIARMRIDAGGVIPMFGIDAFRNHLGRMHGRVLGLFTVADGAGPAIDQSELVTYLNDAVLLAPSMLLTPAVTWRPIDEQTFEVEIADEGTRAAARCTVDDDGRLVDFRTDDRWYAGTDPPTRATWSTPVDGWTTLPDGRRAPISASAVWHLADGAFTYVHGRFDLPTLTFEEARPRATTARPGGT